MTITKIFTSYIKIRLTKLGYDDLANEKLHWELGFCSKIDFTRTSIHPDDAVILCDRLLEGQDRSAVKRAFAKDLTIEVGGRWEAEMQLDESFTYTPKEIAACERFINKIDVDLLNLENKLLEEGELFFNATRPEDEPEIAIKRCMGRFKFVVSKVNAELLDLFSSNDEETIEYDLDTMNQILAGKLNYFDLEFKLLDRFDDDKLVARSYLGSCTLGVDESFNSICGSTVREFLTELVDEARTVMDRRVPKRDALAEAKREAYQQQVLRKKEEAEAEKLAKQLLEAAAAKRLAEQAEREAKKIAQEKEYTLWSGISLA